MLDQQNARAAYRHQNCRHRHRLAIVQSSRKGEEPGDCDRQAVRREQQHRAARFVAPEPVAVVVHRAGSDDPARPGAGDGRPVALPGHRRTVGVGVDRDAEACAVLDDACGIVLGADTEIERAERPVADTAEPRREGDAVRACGQERDR